LKYLVTYSFEILLCLLEFYLEKGKDKITFNEIKKRIGGNRQKFYHRCKTLEKNGLILKNKSPIKSYKNRSVILYSITKKGINSVLNFIMKYQFIDNIIRFFKKYPSYSDIDIKKYRELIK